MKIKTKKLPDSQIELTIELSDQELAPYYKKAAEKISKESPIKGFRPGGAPADVVKKIVGDERLFAEVADRAVKESYVKAVIQEKIQPVGKPTVEILPIVSDGGLRFKAKAPVLPEVEVPDWQKIKIKKEPVDVKDKEVTKALETLQKSRAAYATVTRPAQKGDRVEIDFQSFVTGVPVEGGESKQHPLIIGEGHFLGGFEDKLIGMKEGEKKKFSVKAPEDYPQPSLAGRTIDFSVTMRLVQSVELPEINDEFSGKVGKFKNLESLKKSIREGLKEEKEKREREKIRVTMVEKILEKTPDFEIPESLISQEIEKMEQELSVSLARMGLGRESYLAHIKKSMDELRNGWKGQAEKRVRAALVLSGIAQKEDILATKEDIESKISELVSSVSPEEAEKIDTEGLRGTVEGLVRNEKVFELLESKMVEK